MHVASRVVERHGIFPAGGSMPTPEKKKDLGSLEIRK